MNLSFKHIAPFINAHSNKASRWFSYIGLGIGVLLLLCSIQMYINIDAVLKDKSPRKNGFDYIPITKIITNENMGKDNRFTDDDIKELNSQPFIEEAAPLRPNLCKISAGAGDVIPFTTDIFVESLNSNFIDTVPPTFTWSKGQEVVPIIFSTDFLEMYNVFAPSWDLPQLSQKTAEGITVFLHCHGHNGEEVFKARIVAFSDRVTSILVPENFLTQINMDLDGVEYGNTSRVFLKTKDANNPQLLSFLAQKEYYVNKDKTKFGRIKQILQGVMSGLTGFGLLIILLAMGLFSFYLQLMIARSKENLQLLLTLGYSPGWLSKTVAKKWVPVYTIIVISALLVTSLLQLGFRYYVMNDNDQLSAFVHPVIILLSAVLIFLSALINYKTIKKLLIKL
jgi:hypothetical protein